MLREDHSVTNDVLKEDLEYASRFLVDEARDALLQRDRERVERMGFRYQDLAEEKGHGAPLPAHLDTSTTSEAANGALGHALDVVTVRAERERER